MKKLSAILLMPVLWALCGSLAFGQEHWLDPKNWFPLDLGSYWHYTNEGGEGVTIITEWIDVAAQDSVIDGKRWTRVETVWCSDGPDCPSHTKWYRFTEDSYLLFRILEANYPPDTVLATTPISVFSVTGRTDSLETGMTGPDYPLEVSIITNEMGSEADSTHLILDVYAHVFFRGKFVYNIGLADGLIGAVVKGVAYGDTTAIQRVVLSTEELLTNSGRGISIYPNPFSEHTTIQVTSLRAGSHYLEIFDAIGRRVYAEELYLDGQTATIGWAPPRSLPSGMYLVTVTDQSGLRVQSSAVMTK